MMSDQDICESVKRKRDEESQILAAKRPKTESVDQAPVVAPSIDFDKKVKSTMVPTVSLEVSTARVNLEDSEGTESPDLLSHIAFSRLSQQPEFSALLNRRNPEVLLSSRAKKGGSSRRKRALLVDDIKVNQRITALGLSRAGFEADFASDGGQAVEMACKSEYSIVLMDVKLPTMDGVTATVHIRDFERQHPSRPASLILGMTGAVGRSDLLRYRDAGMDGCIEKGCVVADAVNRAYQLKRDQTNSPFLFIAANSSARWSHEIFSDEEGSHSHSHSHSSATSDGASSAAAILTTSTPLSDLPLTRTPTAPVRGLSPARSPSSHHNSSSSSSLGFSSSSSSAASASSSSTSSIAAAVAAVVVSGSPTLPSTSSSTTRTTIPKTAAAVKASSSSSPLCAASSSFTMLPSAEPARTD